MQADSQDQLAADATFSPDEVLIARPSHARMEAIRAEAKKKRFIANVKVITATVAVLALAAILYALLSP